MDQLKKEIVLDKGLYWEVKSGIIFDKKTESFVDYLQKEKKTFDHPRSITQKILALIVIFLLGFIMVGSTSFTVQTILELFLGTFQSQTENIQAELVAGLILATSIATSIGLLFSIVTIFFKFFFTQSKWSGFHDQTLSFFRRLEKAGQLDRFIVFTKNEKKESFKIFRISIDFELEWIFPFIFDDFPPLLFELLLLSFLLPFFVSTLISLILNLIQAELIIIIFLSFLLLFILFGFEQAGSAIFLSWKYYNFLLHSMISKQQEFIHSLILDEAEEITIIRHQNNLMRLLSLPSFPLPPLIRISTIIPLLGSLLGYLLAIAAIM